MQVIRFEVDFAIDNEIVNSEELKSKLIGLIQDQLCDKTTIGNVVSKNVIYSNGEVQNKPPYSLIKRDISIEPQPLDEPKVTKVWY